MDKLVVKEIMVLPQDEKLTADVYLIDGSVLHIRERYKNNTLIKYSYHLIKDEKIFRWDNVPHHKRLKTFPYHKHENDKIWDSEKMNIDAVLQAIKHIMRMKLR